MCFCLCALGAKIQKIRVEKLSFASLKMAKNGQRRKNFTFVIAYKTAR